MQAIGDQAPIMAQKTVDSLSRIAEAQKSGKLQAEAWGGAFVLGINEAGYAVGNFLSWFDPAHFGKTNDDLLKLEGAFNDPDGLKGAIASVKPAVIDVGDALHAFGTTSSADVDRVK